MIYQVIYYKPDYTKKNKSGNGLLTIDWFKKHFNNIVFDSGKYLKYYVEYKYIECDNLYIPQIGWFVHREYKIYKNDVYIHGRVEAIVSQANEHENIVHILINEK